MGGRINVISRKNFGTKFEVFLPFEYDKSEHKATPLRHLGIKKS